VGWEREDFVNKLEKRLVRARSLLLAVSILSVSMLAVTLGGVAAAEQESPNSEPPAAPKQVPEKEKLPFKHYSITANPLSMIFTRVGANLEYMPAPHHGIMLYPSYFEWNFSFGFAGASAGTKLKLYGIELGYHFYTGEKGPNGFFIGPSLILMRDKRTLTASHDSYGDESLEGTGNWYGVALDFGGQHVFDGGFTIGGGLGAMRLTRNGIENSGVTIKYTGVLPRFLFMIGYSF